jgi:hypothetical protein
MKRLLFSGSTKTVIYRTPKVKPKSRGRFDDGSASHSERQVEFARFEPIPRSSDRLRYRVAGTFSETYRQRLAWSACAPDVGQALRRAAASRDRRLLFVKNPKAACTTGAQLVHLYDHGAFCLSENIHDSTAIRQGLQHATHHMAVLANDEAIRFTFVRNPLDRVISAFCMFFTRPCHSEKERDRERGMRALGFDQSHSSSRNFDIFLEYLDHCFATDPAHCNPHWRQQIHNLAHGSIDYHVVGRVEALPEAIRELELRLDHRFCEVDGWSAPQFNRSPSIERAVFCVSDRQRRKVRDLYAADFEAFSY